MPPSAEDAVSPLPAAALRAARAALSRACRSWRHQARILPKNAVGPQLVLHEARPDVGRPLKRRPVRDRALGHGGDEPIRVPD